MSILMKAIPSTEKCFMDEEIGRKPLLAQDTVLRGEEYHFEIAYTVGDSDYNLRQALYLKVCSPLPVLVEKVEQVPVRVPCYPGAADDNYLRTQPGLYPDLLVPVGEATRLFAPYRELKSLFVTVKVPEDMPAGTYPVSLALRDEQGNIQAETSVALRVIPALLPKQKLQYTQWFHCDCIATYYNLEIFSEEHWAYMERYLRTAAENGVDTILTPVFTPPLDTAVGGERPTVQLVDVEKTAEGWRFGFSRLERWVAMCRRCGIENFEISHLFTQWGAKHAPKIIARVDGQPKQVFGWETDSLGAEYREFLEAFLPALLEEMKSLDGADRHCIFHISDEPSLEHLEQYRAVKASVAGLLEGYPIMDALSSFEFYRTGAVAHPIPANDHIAPFLEAEVPGLWTYYCCGQKLDVSNRFLAMPMARTRIIGAQMWKYRIAGFLHWGYNFWYSQYSLAPINPFYITDGDYFTPAGDCYSVYPGPKGQPYNSLHMKAFTEALHDLRAMELAETLAGREAVLAAMEDGLAEPVTFSRYPHEAAYVTGVRARVHALIEQNL